MNVFVPADLVALYRLQSVAYTIRTVGGARPIGVRCYSPLGGLKARRHPKLFARDGEVLLDGPVRDAELRPNPFARKPLVHEAKAIPLPIGEKLNLRQSTTQFAHEANEGKLW